MTYSFDDIKGPVTLLTSLYADLNTAEIAAGQGKPTASPRILHVLGLLREPLSDDDQQRFDLVVDKLIETRLNAQYDARSS